MDDHTLEATQEKVQQIIVEQMGCDEGDVLPGTLFMDDLGADSLDMVELCMAFEEAFDIEIGDDECEKVKSVKDAMDLVTKKTRPRLA